LTDYGLMYIAIILIYKLYTNNLKKLPQELKFVNYLLVFIFIAIFVDLTYNGTSVDDIFRSSRLWLFFLFVYLLPSFSKDEILVTIKWIIYITIIELFLFLLEPLFGMAFFSDAGTIKALTIDPNGRYALIPPYLIFVFSWIYAGNIIKYKNIILGLLFIAFVLTLTRSLILAILMVVIFSIFLVKGVSSLKRISIVVFLFLFAFSISFYEPLAKRFDEGASEFHSSRIEEKGNMTYRLLLAGERLDFILKDVETTIFGIGYITEKHYHGHFKIGLKNDEGEVIQLDTGDIAWALLFIRLGLVGTFIFIALYIKLLNYFFKNRENRYALAGFYYLFIFLLLSTAGTIITMGTFIVIPALLYKLTSKDENLKGVSK